MTPGGFFLNGLAVGFSIAAPVGPIGVLCIRTTLAQGALRGLSSGLGAATADAVYGCVAAFGLTAVSEFLARQQFALGLVGGVFLCCLGIRSIFSRHRGDSASPGGGGPVSAYGSTFLLTLANPATILSFAAVFVGLGLGRAPDYGSAGATVLGVFLGSTLWWVILSGAVGLLRERIGTGWTAAISWVSGAVLVAFGVYALCRI